MWNSPSSAGITKSVSWRNDHLNYFFQWPAGDKNQLSLQPRQQGTVLHKVPWLHVVCYPPFESVVIASLAFFLARKHLVPKKGAYPTIAQKHFNGADSYQHWSEIWVFFSSSKDREHRSNSHHGSGVWNTCKMAYGGDSWLGCTTSRGCSCAAACGNFRQCLCDAGCCFTTSRANTYTHQLTETWDCQLFVPQLTQLTLGSNRCMWDDLHEQCRTP